MKKIIYTLFAFAAVTFVSCTKEESTPENEQSQPEVELVPMTFTAGVDTKVTLGVNNAINWEKTDKISIFDGTGNREFTIVESSIVGNTATFTGEVAATATDFVALYPYASEAKYDAGKITGVPLSKTGKFAPVATASASSDNNILNFTTVIGFVKFKLADAEGVTSVTISGNNGELIGGSITIDTKEGKTTAVAPAITIAPEGGIQANTDYYIPMAAGTIASGITISTTNGTTYSYKTSTKSTTISANTAFNLGSLSGFFSTPKNYVKWIHGDSFTIGGQTFNQAANGQATLLNSTSTTNVNEGVYFIDSDVKNKTMGSQKSIIVIGNDPAKRSSLTRNKITYITATEKTDNWILSNIELSFTDIKEQYAAAINTDANTFENIIIDNCQIILPTTTNTTKTVNFINVYNKTSTVKNFIITNSEFIGQESYTHSLFNANKANNIEFAEFSNNVFYTTDISKPTSNFSLINASSATVDKLVMNKNTFYGAFNEGPAFSCTFKSSVSFTGNMFCLPNTKSASTNTYIIGTNQNSTEINVTTENNAYYNNTTLTNNQPKLYFIQDSYNNTGKTFNNPISVGISTNSWNPSNKQFTINSNYGATR